MISICRTPGRWRFSITALTLLLFVLPSSGQQATQEAQPKVTPVTPAQQSKCPRTEPVPESREIPLWDDGVPLAWERDKPTKLEHRDDDHYFRWIEGVAVPTLTVYPADKSNNSGAAVVICPGGGFRGLAIDHEGHDVARWLNSLGVTGIVLKYRTHPVKVGVPRVDVQEAIRYTRRHAEEWHLQSDRIGVLGFSAGGHLASTAGTHFGDDKLARPDFMVLIYPVISMSADVMHRGSRNNILGKDPPAELALEFSNELRVTNDTPPTFLAHSTNDKAVPIKNSLLIKAALEKHGVPVRMESYETGGHGYGMGRGETSAWPAACAAWMAERGIINDDSSAPIESN